MDIASLSMALSNSKVQDAASLAVMKMAMNKGKENSVQMTD